MDVLNDILTKKHIGDMLDLYSQKLTANVPENGPSQKGSFHLPTIPFSGAMC